MTRIRRWLRYYFIYWMIIPAGISAAWLAHSIGVNTMVSTLLVGPLVGLVWLVLAVITEETNRFIDTNT